MNRLWVRLTLAFIAVTLLTAGLVAVLATWTVNQQFRGYLVQPDVLLRGGVVQVLGVYYAQNGSWEGIENLLERRRRRPPLPLRARALERETGARGWALLITDAEGRVVYDEQNRALGSRLSEEELARVGVPIYVDGEVRGFAVATVAAGEIIGQAEQRFLDGLQRSIVLAALASAAFGAVIGAGISRSLNRPLSALARAAHAFAGGDWQQRLPPKLTSITELREVAQAFNTMAESLQRAEQQRRNLMADIAHELRTPLSAMQGLLRALLDGVYPLTLKEVSTLYDETRLLTRLVDDVRVLALAEARQLPMQMQIVAVERLLVQTAEHFAPLADERNITLNVIKPSVPLWVHADPDRTAQVLRNLVSNALRHTPPGGTITLSAELSTAGVRFTVQDTGEGIAPEDLPFVFDRFYRSDKSRARSTGGAGLGLAIAKSFVEMMGGQIGVHSAPGQGATFWFTLPQAMPNSSQSAQSFS